MIILFILALIIIGCFFIYQDRLKGGFQTAWLAPPEEAFIVDLLTQAYLRTYEKDAMTDLKSNINNGLLDNKNEIGKNMRQYIGTAIEHLGLDEEVVPGIDKLNEQLDKKGLKLDEQADAKLRALIHSNTSLNDRALNKTIELYNFISKELSKVGAKYVLAAFAYIEAAVYLSTSNKKLTISNKQPSSGGFNTALFCELDGVPVVLRAYRNRGNDKTYNAYDSLCQVLEVFKDSDCILHPLYSSKDLKIRRDRYMCLWTISQLMEPITYDVIKNKEAFVEYVKTLVKIAKIAHSHGYVYGDWKLSNSMKYPGKTKFALTDIDLTPMTSHSIVHTHKNMFTRNKSKYRYPFDYYLYLDNTLLIKEAYSVYISLAGSETADEFKKNYRNTYANEDLIRYVKFNITDDEVDDVIDDLLQMPF